MDVEKVIEELEEAREYGSDSTPWINKVLDNAIQTIRELQEQNNWHLVKDGDLPSEISKHVLVKLKNGGVMYAVWSGVSKCFKSVCEYGVYGFYKDNPVIAWRELPKFEGVE